MPQLLRGAWCRPRDALGLADGEVHVWRVGLTLPERQVRELRALLSRDERCRADGFVLPRHARRFTVARAQLRRVLARYACTPPAELRFSYGEYEKPRLDLTREGAVRADDLRFNVSHSGDLALFAVARGREVGIDVEALRPGVRWQQIARSSFSPPELEQLHRLPEAQRPRAFFRGWTCKEAYVKARGEGLVHPLEGFSVEVRPDRPAALLSSRADPREVHRWRLQEVDAGAGYVAALALERRRRRRPLETPPGAAAPPGRLRQRPRRRR